MRTWSKIRMYILVSRSSISELVAISVAVFKGRFPVLAVVLQNNKEEK